ncbi:AGAP004430-PA [Anopheles gambiae str. PEST]|uniref:5'-3' exoribonuclease 1 n=1 Tax=Anopheles gambiae TaxID=7165 RepID=Q7PQ65_ANOGA|nr:AGAP004430-PA [Anopheles gambiae str. PEST]
MGVPKFFRYMSERYPCLSELLRENQVPEFDNLYLDMNGIIHNCSHPNDADVHFRISEEMIFEGIFHYVEYLFKLIRPQQVFFIAVDGVAPRAKMNQQRGRRFRSAAEAQDLLEKAKAKGEEISSESPFDSNCITPGTSFMVRLQNALQHFIQVKIATDRLWKACTVILSGHETPGEGEHKIMEYIRHAKAQPGFNPNTRHCLYGLDADLIMLGLCTHERYFSLLREEVKFGKNDKKTSNLKEIRFYLLHLTLLSEYLELEFASVRDRLRFPFDIHKLIDDWILLVYLVGNDFIPHMPHLHINENALPTLYEAYMDVLPNMDGYINEAGILNLPRLQMLMRRLANFDRDMFLDRYTDLKYLEGKCGKNNLDAFDVDANEIIGASEMDKDLMALIMSSEMLDSEGEDNAAPVTLGDIENDPELFEQEFKNYKRNYYMSKMGYADFTEEVRAEQAECYIRALQWTLHYYYRGVVSWSWYYPHHYAPFISDVDNFAHLKLDYELARPFLPFQQLLSVLPAASKQHLPSAYHQLMTDPNSSVYDFYPVNFATDLNGKQQAWEAVVLIPFIDEKRLLKAMGPCDAFLTDEEKQRNVHGPMLKYQYDTKQHAPLEAKYGFDRVDELHVKCSEIWRDDLRVAENRLVLGPSQGAVLHGYAKGFPTFAHLPYHGELKELRVKIFNFASKNESMVVVLDTPDGQPSDTAELAKELLGKVVHVSWPHLMEAIVVRVSDRSKTYERNSEPLPTDERSFNMWCRSIIEHNNNRLAINVGTIKQLVHVRIAVGTEYVLKDNGFVLKKLWNTIDTAYPAQTIIQDLQDIMAKQKPYIEMEEMFPRESVVFLRATEFYGSMGNVVDVSGSTKRVQARFLVYEEPDLGQVYNVHRQSLQGYRNANDTAAMLGISVGLLLQLTGSILVAPGGHRALNVDEKSLNIGLRLRMISKDEEAVGYCRKVNKTWLFSDKTVKLMQQYMERAPGLFEKLDCSRKTNVHFETDLFGEGNEGKLQELYDWLKVQEHVNSERRSCGIILLEEKAIEALAETIDKYQTLHQPKVQTMFVDPKELYRPGMKNAKMIDPSAHFELLDRIIVVQEKEDVPVGARGTIIGIHRVSDPNPVRREAIGQEDTNFEVLFDKPFYKGVDIYNISSTEKRVLRLSQSVIMNISHGKASAGYRYKVSVDRSNAVRKETPAATEGRSANKSMATAESIQRRVNERIGKRSNATNNVSLAGTSATRPTEQNVMQQKDGDQQRKIEFERLWRKLKESPKAPGELFDAMDIQNIVQAPPAEKSSWRRKPEDDATLPKKDGEQWNGDNMTGYLKQMLRIDEKAGSEKGSEKSVNPASIAVPAPASLPKPPIQWQTQAASKSPAKGPTAVPLTEVNETTKNNTNNTANQFIAQYMKTPQPQMASMAQPMHLGFRPMLRPPTHTFDPRHPQPQFGPMIMQPVFMQTGTNMHQSMGAFQQPAMPPFPQNMPMRPPVPFPNRMENSVPFPPHGHGLNNAPAKMMVQQQQQQQQQQQHQQQHHQQKQQHQVQPHYPSNWGPKGPQHLSYNKNNPAGNGAFVPLQAMKKTAKGKSGGGSGSANYSNVSNVAAAAASETLISQNVKNQPTPPSKTNGQTTGGFNEKNARRRQEVEQKQAEVKQGFATFLSQKSDTKQQKNKHNSNTSTAKKQSTVVTAVKDQDGQIEDTSVVKQTPSKSKPKTRIAARFGVASEG